MLAKNSNLIETSLLTPNLNLIPAVYGRKATQIVSI